MKDIRRMPERDTRVLSFSTLARYGIGQTGAQVFRDTPAALLPIFMTTLLGVEPWMAGIAVIIPKLWLIIFDPLVGIWSDRVKERVGRGPFLIIGALLTNIGFICLFSLSGFTNPVAAAAAVSAIFLLASCGFSAFSVPYLAIASELSSDAQQRSRIIASRVTFAILGVIIGVGLAQPMIALFGGGSHGWRMMAAIFSVVCLVTMLVTALTVPRLIDRTPTPAQQGGLFSQLFEAFQHRDFRWLTITYLLQCVGQASGYTVIGFVFFYNVGNVNLILPFVLIMSVGSVISQPIWLALARRFGNPACFTASNIGWILLTISAFTISPGTDVLTTLPLLGPLSTQQVILLARGLPLAFFNSGFLLFVLSMLTDTIDRIRRRSGQVNEGVFSGIFSATEKLSFAIAPLIGGVVMSLCGFVASTGGAQAQSQEAMTGILMLYSLIPAGILTLSALAFTGYLAAVRRETMAGATVASLPA